LANTVYSVEEIELQDGRTATLRPLVIKRLRRFMKMMGEMGTADEPEIAEDIMFNCAAFCLSKEHPQYWDNNKSNGSYPDPEYVVTGAEGEEIPQIDRLKGGYTEEFEEAADTPTITRILKVCGGIDFENPELMKAALAAQQQEAGTTD
jgi:hypothetical protein